MYSEINSLSFMGVSDSQMLFSDKDLNAMKLNFLAKPTLEFQDQCPTAPSEDHGLIKKPEVKEKEDQEQDHEEKEDKCNISVLSSLRLKIPPPGEFRNVEDDDDGFKTPTSLDNKIPVVLQCPPAPRKPKPRAVQTKRRGAARRRILLDLSNEIESLFPPALLVDLSGKIKKITERR
ncbi:cyclin-dependent protein kinase inhibitor SMR3-like isoform X1 [Juglans microcarpa x Juglans regia]|uniref:cyclin-dependent protein kinase inhibitor SMR3-like isoform X1 n=1 Tax=Juglans microcarpa x Juglans regia TaxID=2249226 RepID=UPI001B7ECE12|nr:cyclin-dependent protein kinase inhibitor SMR3-like isoform X1 [Juglans microcarpa x Juglans regia]